MNGYVTVQDAAVKWSVTDRQVQLWCKSGKIPGAIMLSRIWIIPDGAERPVSRKRENNRRIKTINAPKCD